MRHPNALKKPLTLEELNARLIADPLRLFDCVMPCAGAEAFLVMRRERAEELGLKYARVLATMERHNSFPEDPVQTRGGWALDRDELFAQAGVRHGDIDFVQTYDDYPVISVMQIEDLGFCAKGEGPDFVRSQTFTVDGSFPMNTSGGQLSRGQAGAAGGYLGMTEAIRQLTGVPLGASVADAQVGLVSGFGTQLRSRVVLWGGDIGGRAGLSESPMTPPALPPTQRSRVALGLTSAAAVGRFELQVCEDCGAVNIRREEAFHKCCVRLRWTVQSGDGRLLAETTLFHSHSEFFRERLPWRLGMVSTGLWPDCDHSFTRQGNRRADAGESPHATRPRGAGRAVCISDRRCRPGGQGVTRDDF